MNDFKQFKSMLMNKVENELQRAIKEDELELEKGADAIMLKFIDFIIEEEKDDSALLFAKMLICFGVDVIEEANRERILEFFKGVIDDE